MPSRYHDFTDDTIDCLFFTGNGFKESSCWQNICDALNQTIDCLAAGYLWHKDRFQIFVPIADEKLKNVPDHLRSCTRFGDNVEDEWFIVHLIYELTKQFTDLIVQIQDNDGHFLLIEAADCLPKWMNPDNTVNRVFIYKGDIHIIPPCLTDLDKELSISEAIDLVINYSETTKGPIEIQEAIGKIINSYPRKIKDMMHKALVKIPLELAAVLKLAPQLIAPIVNTYCSHDVIDAKCCKGINLQDDSVCVQIQFTKCLYAMLTHSKLLNTAANKNTVKHDKQTMLGLKIFCGYKMIMKESSDMLSTKEYNKFLQNLIKNGYFKENIEGSKNYTSLLNKANEYYTSQLCPINNNICNQIQNLISSREFQMQEQYLKNNDESSIDDDNEDWLNIHPEQLNDLLMSRYGMQAKFKNDVTAQCMTDQLSSFLCQTSDYEGIELNDRGISQDNNEIDFDPDLFSESLHKILNFITQGNETNEDSEDGFISDNDDINEDEISEKVDSELRETLASDIMKQNETENNKTIYDSFMQGIKEEGHSGPTSNLFKTLSTIKQDELDSDDDEE